MNPRVSRQQTAALTLVEVLVVIGVIAVLVAMLLPAGRNPVRVRRIMCVQNLKQIGLAFRVWEGDHVDKYSMQTSVTNGGTMELTADGKNAWLNFLVMSNELATPKILWCPADKDHVIAPNWTAGFSASNISYFINLDAKDVYPQMFLCGDDNFAIGGVPVKPGLLILSTNAPITWTAKRHVNQGYIALADGSVSSVNNSGLRNLLHQTGVATNRLAIP